MKLPEPPAWIVLTGTLSFVPMMIFIFCVASLRTYTDVNMLKDSEKAKIYIKRPIPSYEMLTIQGKRRYKTGKIALIIWVLMLATIIIYNVMHS